MVRSLIRFSLIALLPIAAVACSGAGTTTSVGSSPRAVAGPQFARPAGTFYAPYTGERRPALDVVAESGAYSPGKGVIMFAVTLAGLVTAGAPNYYVFGIDRGEATNAPFPGEPNVRFNAVVVVTVLADGTATTAVNLIPGSSTTLPAGATTVAGATLTVVVPVSLLPSTGSSITSPGPANLQIAQWNLWPRSGLGGAASAQIASFAPENAMLPFAFVP